MSLTGSQILAEVQALLSTTTSTNDPFWSDVDLYRSITNALRWLWGVLPEKFLESYISTQTLDIVSGTAEYDLNDDIFMIDKVYWNGYECRHKTYDEITELLNNGLVKPTVFQPVYYQRAGYIGLSPTPDEDDAAGCAVHYIKVSPTVDDAADTVDIADKFLPVVAKRAAGEAKVFKESAQEGRELLDAATAALYEILGRRRKLDTEPEKPDRGEDKK